MKIRHNAADVARAFRQAPEIMTREVEQPLDRGALEIANDARQAAPKAHSHLTNAITIQRPRRLRREIVAGMDYALAVEQGTGPGGWPRRQTLIDWIRVRRIQPRDPSLDDRDLAFLIGRAIRRRGTPAQPYMQPSLEAKRSRLDSLIQQGVADGLRQVESLA